MTARHVIALVVLGVVTQACCGMRPQATELQPEPQSAGAAGENGGVAKAPDGGAGGAAAGAEDGDTGGYTIELVFQGLTTVSSRQDGTWLLLGNTSDVAQLRFQRDPRAPTSLPIARHQPRLLLPTAPPSGVTLTPSMPASPARMCPPESDAAPGTNWQELPIAGLHLTLVGNLSPVARQFTAGASGHQPCVDGAGCTAERAIAEGSDIRWIRSVTEIFGLAGTPRAFREELFAPSYSPAGFPVLSTRVFLGKGVVKASSLDRFGEEEAVAQYHVEGVPDWGPRALARQVVVELKAQGPVTLVGRDLRQAGARPAPLVTLASTGPTVRVVIGNDAGDLDCHGNLNDWVMSYNYLDGPPPANFSAGPIVVTPGPGLHGSCSPDRG